MFKRMLLTFMFIAALGAAGLGMSSKAMAHRGCYDGYGYGGNQAYYPSYGYGYGPTYYRSYGSPVYYGSYYGGHHGYSHHGHSGLTFTFGF